MGAGRIKQHFNIPKRKTFPNLNVSVYLSNNVHQPSVKKESKIKK